MSSGDEIDLTDAQLRSVLDLIGQHLPGVTVWAYGSRVKGTARRTSDLDLVVFVDEDSRSLVSGLKESFDESDLTFPVDLHIWDEIPTSFQKEISAHKLDLTPLVSQLLHPSNGHDHPEVDNP
jgi:predicted nucleotidyltransferase